MRKSVKIPFPDAKGRRVFAWAESFGGPIVLVSFFRGTSRWFRGARLARKGPVFRSRFDADKAIFLDPIPDHDVASVLPGLADRFAKKISRDLNKSERALAFAR